MRHRVIAIVLFLLWLFGKSHGAFPNQINIGKLYLKLLKCFFFSLKRKRDKCTLKACVMLTSFALIIICIIHCQVHQSYPKER